MRQRFTVSLSLAAVHAARFGSQSLLQLSQQCFECRISNCSFPGRGNRFEVAAVQGIEILQDFKILRQKLFDFVHGRNSSWAAAKWDRSACSALQTRTRAAPAVETPRALARAVPSSPR